MIIEELIRLGKIILESKLDSKEILRLVSDVEKQTAKNFYKHVFVVEIADGEESRIGVSYQVWGQEIKKDNGRPKTDFLPDSEKALGAPFVLPFGGGNPRHPQGNYGIPSYPWLFEHLKAFKQSPDGITQFLSGRLQRTPTINVSENHLKKISESIHRVVAQFEIGDKEKFLGLLVLVDMRDPDSLYKYVSKSSRNDLGQSAFVPGKFIEPRFDLIMERFLQAKSVEGAAEGQIEGTCTICAHEGILTSAYCKSWPWALPTWTCPLPHGGNREFLVEGIALCQKCYEALVFGSSVFEKLTSPISSIVTKEIFSPATDSVGKKNSSRRKISDLPKIYGSGYLLPLLDVTDKRDAEDFAADLQVMFNSPSKHENLKAHIEAVTGFDLCLPEKMENDYRLNLLYFSGNPGRGDIHLRARIEDILPSTLGQLNDMASLCADNATFLQKATRNTPSEKQVAYYRQLYRTIPWLLARAYGGSSVWEKLQAVLHRRPLPSEECVRKASKRLQSLSPLYPDSLYDIYDEVTFYIAFSEFASSFNNSLSKGGTRMADRSWQELLKLVDESPIDELQFQSVAELGFACGVFMRQFGRQYYAVLKKDYLKQRVLTFGADLMPEEVWRRGLSRIFEVAERYEKIQLSDNFRRRIGVILDEYHRLHEDVAREKDQFIASFWSGFALQGYKDDVKEQ